MQHDLWGPENHVHRLRELVAAAFSAGQAADALAQETGLPFTRDAVKTKARGLGLTLQGKAGRRAKEATTLDPESVKRYEREASDNKRGRDWRQAVTGFALHPIPLPVSEFRVVPARGTPLPFIARPEGCCAWPVSDWLEEGTAQTPFCCAASEPGRSYCRDHVAIAYQASAA